MSKVENMYAYYLIDDECTGRGGHEESPYDTDHRGAGERLAPFGFVKNIKSIGNKFPVFRKRELNEEFAGVLTFECTYQIVSGDGFYFGFYGDKGDEKEVCVLRQNDGYVYAGEVAVAKADNNWHYVKLVMDIDKGAVKVCVDGKFVAEVPFTGKAKTISRFIMGYEAGSVGEANLGGEMELYKNFLFCDTIVPKYDGNLPEEYVVTKEGKAKVGMRRYHASSRYSVYYVTACSGSKTTIARNFARAKGNVCLDMRYLLPKAGSKITVSLTNNGEKVVSVYDELQELCSKDGVLRTHHKNVWQNLRIEADTDTNTAKVRLNGKVCSVIAFDTVSDLIDGMLIEFEANKAVELQIADFKCMIIPPYPADYVPEPVVPKKVGDYYIGMNICSLWREGNHYGWDCISPYPAHRPLLGFYDEGIPEAADWELKWMSEHGLDFQLYCWYASEAKRPLMKTMLSAQIHDGHMLARYSDKVKIALLWEASACTHPDCFEDLRDNVFPYFIDYFFSDPRYMQIDGRAIMSIYNPERLASDVGGPDVLRKSFDYLRKEVRKLGYKDLIIMCCGDSNPMYKQAGIDACHCYHWGKKGYDVEFTKARMLHNIEEGSVHQVPCVSMGYNDLPWAGKKYPVLEPSDMVTLLKWCKEELLDKYPDKTSWKSKFMMLSTWNEYGEGTYMMPSGVHGFGYLDALREVFCENTPHADVVPNQNQLDRVNIMYPQDRRLLAANDLYPEDENEYPVLKKYEFKTKEDLAKWEITGLTNYEIRDGKLCGHSDKFDPYMILHDDEFLPIETKKIGKIVAYTSVTKPIDDACCIQHKYMFEPDKWFHTMPACISTPNKVVPLVINPAKTNGLPWNQTLYGFRFDPVYEVGDFELESIVFYEAPLVKRFRIDGKVVDIHCDIKEENTVTYIPFDTKSYLNDVPNLYYEWSHTNKTFTVFSEKTAVFTVGSDVAVVDGKEVKLSATFNLCDGLPYIEADLFADLLGMSVEYLKEEVVFTSK